MRPLGVIGNIALDVVEGERRIGGGAYWCARALRILEAPATVAARCAAGDHDELLPQLTALGVPIHWHPCDVTAGFAFHYEGETRVMRVNAIPPSWTAEDAAGWTAEAVAGARWLHLAALFRSDFPADVLAELARTHRLSLDGQGLVRAPETGPLVLDDGFDRDALRHVTVVKLSEEEAEAVGDISALPVPEVIVTVGSRGAIVHANGTAEHVPTRPVDGEPTGAGDSFAVGYLAARSAGMTPVAAARRANAVAGALIAGVPA